MQTFKEHQAIMLEETSIEAILDEIYEQVDTFKWVSQRVKRFKMGGTFRKALKQWLLAIRRGIDDVRAFTTQHAKDYGFSPGEFIDFLVDLKLMTKKYVVLPRALEVAG